MNTTSLPRIARRIARAGLLALALAGAAAGALASDKRGVGIADRDSPEKITKLNVAWYYTWTPYPVTGLDNDKFVPMVWGGPRLEEHVRALQGRKKPAALLALNEPDGVKQANMSVQDAVATWPRLAALGTRISSPATAGPMGAWADGFDAQSRAKQLRVDFMAVHLYGPPDSRKFLQRLDNIHEKFGKPIWITEFAVADWDAKDMPVGANRYSEEDVLRFLREVIPELEKRPFVERYAWYGAGKNSGPQEALRTSRLYDNTGELTAVGKLYAKF